MSYPLGPPIRPAPKEGPEWVTVDPAKPHIQRNAKSGAMRNIKPPPPLPNPWYGWPVIKP